MEGYKWQTSYSTCKKVVKESLLSRFSWYSISFLAKWAAVHSLGTLTLSHIIATRVGLDYPVWPVFLKNSLTSAIKRLATKKDLGPFKIDRAVVDSNRSVNLPFNIRKILCTYPRKRKDIRGLQMFQIGDLSSFLAGGLTCIRCGDLFVCFLGGYVPPGTPNGHPVLKKEFFLRLIPRSRNSPIFNTPCQNSP